MQAREDWVLIILGTQVTKKKRSVRPVFPDYLSIAELKKVKYFKEIIDFKSFII